MRNTVISILFVLFAAIAHAAPQSTADGTPQHTIYITPGQPWQMRVVLRQADKISPIETQYKHFLATVNSAPPLTESLYVTMKVDISYINPGELLLSLSGEQTASLRGKPAIWTLQYIPPIGGAQAVGTGKVEVKP